MLTALPLFELEPNQPTAGVSPTRPDPWDLTRRISPRDTVRVMRTDAYGRLGDNNYPSIHPLGIHSPTTPWAMHLADTNGAFRALCFDFDGKDSHGTNPELVEQAIDDCDQLSRLLGSLSIAHIVCQSSSSGGRHIWLTLAAATPAATVAALADAARAHFPTLDHGMLHNPRTGAARPPLSPHRDGSHSTVLRGHLDTLSSPTTTIADLDAATRALDATRPAPRKADSAPSGPTDNTHHTHRELSPAGAAHMATISGGNNPSWTGFMCLLSAAHAGWTFTDVQRAASTAPGMEHYRTKNNGRGGRRTRTPGEAQRRLASQWDKAQRYATLQRATPHSSPPVDLTELDDIVTRVSDLLDRFRTNHGRWGRTEKSTSEHSILTAVAYLTLHTGKNTVAASIRDLALMTGLGRTTAATALHSLTADGYLHQATPSEAGNAAEWTLTGTLSTAPRTVRSQPLTNPRPPSELFTIRIVLITQLEQQLTDQRHDIFTRAGIGHLAGKAYALLQHSTGLTLDTAARLLGASHRHLATIFSRLATHRLLTTSPDGYSRSKRDLRDRAARMVGATGTLTARADRYQVEREVWAWWQAELDTMIAHPRQRPRRPHVTSRTLTGGNGPGQRIWPRYPRDADGRGDHRHARYWVDNGMLAPHSLWWSAAA